MKDTKAKGDRIVRGLVKELKEAGVEVKKVWQSGQTWEKKGDIEVVTRRKKKHGGRNLQVEVKARKKLPKLWKEILKENDIAIFVEDRTKEKVCLINFVLLKELLG